MSVDDFTFISILGTKTTDNLDKVYKLKKQYFTLKYCLVCLFDHNLFIFNLFYFVMRNSDG